MNVKHDKHTGWNEASDHTIPLSVSSFCVLIRAVWFSRVNQLSR